MAIAEWCNNNALPLNEKECLVFSYSRHRDVIVFDYAINRNMLQRPNEIIDLGVNFGTKLSLISHIDKVIARGRASLGFILRCLREFFDPYTWYNSVLFDCSFGAGICFGCVVANL